MYCNLNKLDKWSDFKKITQKDLMKIGDMYVQTIDRT